MRSTSLKKAGLIKGYDTDSTNWEREKEANRLSNKLYDELEWEIWSYLHQLGYFSPFNERSKGRAEIGGELNQEFEIVGVD